MSKTIRSTVSTRNPARARRLDGVLRAEARATIRSTQTRNPRVSY